MFAGDNVIALCFAFFLNVELGLKIRLLKHKRALCLASETYPDTSGTWRKCRILQ